jgi:hypothetical protein
MSEASVRSFAALGRWRVRRILRWRGHRRAVIRIARIARRPSLYVVVRSMLLLTGGATLLSLVAASGLRFNVTRSLPLGLYHVVDRPDAGTMELQRGMLVTACLPPDWCSTVLPSREVTHSQPMWGGGPSRTWSGDDSSWLLARCGCSRCSIRSRTTAATTARCPLATSARSFGRFGLVPFAV